MSGVVAAIAARWGAPPDAVAWTALVVAVAVACWPARLAPRLPGRLAWCALGASLLSVGYVAYYLRGGPRIIDATSYYLQGRALAAGHFAWDIAAPSASFRGRFLLFREPHQIAGIFPPGYPLLLAAGFLLGAPLAIGPLTAGALVIATYALARELVPAPLGAARPSEVAFTAALLSLLCATLRYHTADTMSHGACALAFCVALTSALRGARVGRPGPFAVAGGAVGFVVATRLVSSIPIALTTLSLAARVRHHRPRALALFALGAAPGVALLACAQQAATGDPFGSTQQAYYAASDGPPGCFRYGFGDGIGCLFEHGDFVRAHLATGYGLIEAAGTTLRRLSLHLGDVANLEPLAILLILPARGDLGRARWALGLVALQVLAYAPFYFDGNYPGGGARLLADVLPIEHALVAIGLARLWPAARYENKARAAVALACAGFALHTAHDHRRLAERDGGRPMFEPTVVARAGVRRGLLFVDTDHGFNLAHDPSTAPDGGLVVARLRGDDHDRLLFEALGRPPSYAYDRTRQGPRVVAWLAPVRAPADALWRFESEADWPPIGQEGGWAEPLLASDSCASAGRVLLVSPAPGGKTADATLDVPIPAPGDYLVTPHVVRRDGNANGALTLSESEGAPLADTWRWQNSADSGTGTRCEVLATRRVHLASAARMTVSAAGGPVALDRVDLALATR